jgi:hypothetical protein
MFGFSELPLRCSWLSGVFEVFPEPTEPTPLQWCVHRQLSIAHQSEEMVA